MLTVRLVKQIMVLVIAGVVSFNVAAAEEKVPAEVAESESF